MGPPGKGLQRAGTGPSEARLRLSSPLLYPGSARSEGGPWPNGEYPRILLPPVPILQWATPTMGSTASVSLGGWD